MNGLVRYVILRNHRDTWTFRAVDPNSGTAVLMEASKSYLQHVFGESFQCFHCNERFLKQL